MSAKCGICLSPLVGQVDSLIAVGVPLREVERMTGLPYPPLKRHRTNGHANRPGKRPALAAPAPVAVPLPVSPGTSGFPVDACETFRLAFGFEPKSYQVEYLTETRDLVFLKGRQIGATQGSAALAIHTARSQPGSDSIIVSATQRQSSEVAVRARLGLWEIGETLVQDSASVLRLTNGSRILSLAQSAKAVRGYSAALLIMDEAAFIADEVWTAARPMTSATGGRTVVQSTPGVPSGWFYDLTRDTPPSWHSMRVSSPDSGNVSAGFLAAERSRMEPHLYAQEYLAQFASAGSVGRWFSEEIYDRLINKDETRLDAGMQHTEEVT